MKLISAYYKEPDPFFLFDKCVPSVEPKDLDKCDPEDTVLLLWGGADISPSFYNELPVYTNANYYKSKRDWMEEQMVKKAVERGIKIVGICRGAQLLCALAGGKLIQHLDHHENNHLITTKEGHTLLGNSSHHQMMLPNEDGEVIAWSTYRQSKRYFSEGGQLDVPPPQEVEVVWWKKWNALGIQGHPEYMKRTSEFVGYCQNLVKEYILK